MMFYSATRGMMSWLVPGMDQLDGSSGRDRLRGGQGPTRTL